MYAPTIFDYLFTGLFSLVFILPIILFLTLIIKLISYKIIGSRGKFRAFIHNAFNISMLGIIYSVLYNVIRFKIGHMEIFYIIFFIISCIVLSFSEYKILVMNTPKERRNLMTILSIASTILIMLAFIEVSNGFLLVYIN